MKTRNVICQSGLRGSRYRLRKNYGTFEAFEAYCETYGIHTRLGYATPAEAWDANPWMELSVNPSDLRAVHA